MIGDGRAAPSGDAATWFDGRFRVAGALYSLYCFPFAGGSASYYADWAGHFAADVELVPVQLPARGVRMAEPPPTDLDRVADAVAGLIAREPSVPLLFGHSMGAIIAFEVARRLQESGRPARHLFVSGRPAPSLVRPRVRVSTLPRAELVQVLRDFGATGEEVLAHDELLDLLLPMIRADFALIEGYRYRPGPALGCPVHAWCGDRDPDVRPDDMRGWGEETTSGFTMNVLPGGHFFLTGHGAVVADGVHGAVTRTG